MIDRQYSIPLSAASCITQHLPTPGPRNIKFAGDTGNNFYSIILVLYLCEELKMV